MMSPEESAQIIAAQFSELMEDRARATCKQANLCGLVGISVDIIPDLDSPAESIIQTDMTCQNNDCGISPKKVAAGVQMLFDRANEHLDRRMGGADNN